MKKNLHRLLTLLLLLIGSSSLFAQTKTITFDATKDKGNQFGKSASISKDGITIAVSDGSLASYENLTRYRFYASSSCTITSAVGNIKKVVFFSNDWRDSPKNFTYHKHRKVSIMKANVHGLEIRRRLHLRLFP